MNKQWFIVLSSINVFMDLCILFMFCSFLPGVPVVVVVFIGIIIAGHISIITKEILNYDR